MTFKQHSWRNTSTWTLSFSSFTLASSFCFSTSMVDDNPTPSCCKDQPLLNMCSNVHVLQICNKYHVTPAGLQVLPQCSLLCPRFSVPPSDFWRWSWPCVQDLPGTDPAETSTPSIQHTVATAWSNATKKIKSKCRLTCRFLLILRMLCCSRNLFSRAKRLCWSSNWARRSWNRTLARESCNATVSLERNISKSLPDAPHAQPR